MANAMVQLQSITLAAASSSVTFSNISQNYRDLRFINLISSTSGNQDVGVNFNGTTGTSHVYMAGFGTSTGSGTGTDLMGYVNSSGLLNQIDILDYSTADKHKPGLNRYGSDANFAAAVAFRWANTAPITSVRFYLGTGTFSAGSTFTLYGIAG